MSDQTTLGRPPVRHPVYIAWGKFILKLRDQGITPGPDSLTFTRAGRVTTRPYADIAEINLTVSALPRVGDVAQMSIRFRNGLNMRVLNTDAWGTPDPDQTQHYYRFKADLHERLVDSGAAARIAFTSGYTAGRAKAVKVVMAIGAAFFIGAPIIIFFMTGQAQALLVCLGGAALLLPFFRTSGRNAPTRYDPRHPPDMLA
jgi:hypothetical protein